MDHGDHVALLRAAVRPGGTWADIGAGSGAFTLALADLLGPGGAILAVDRDAGALRDNERAVTARFPGVALTTVTTSVSWPTVIVALIDAMNPLVNSMLSRCCLVNPCSVNVAV